MVDRLLPAARAQSLWAKVLNEAGLTGTEADLPSMINLVQALMQAADPVVAMCARGLQIRLASYQLLRFTQTLVIGGTP